MEEADRQARAARFQLLAAADAAVSLAACTFLFNTLFRACVSYLVFSLCFYNLNGVARRHRPRDRNPWQVRSARSQRSYRGLVHCVYRSIIVDANWAYRAPRAHV
jgi:hypothetical protein